MNDPWLEVAPILGKGDELASLRALRDRIAADLDNTRSARDVASLGRLLADVLERIARVEAATPDVKGTPLDELARRRAGRGSPDSGGAPGRGRKSSPRG